MKPPWVFAFFMTLFGLAVLSQSRMETGEVIWGYEIALCGALGMLLAVVFEYMYVGGD